TPGMFGNMRLASSGSEKVLLVPDTAVQTDQTRKLLLVVDKEGTVSAKEVALGPVIDGGLRVVRGGLTAGDRVIIEGTQMAMPGGKVTARSGRIEPPTIAKPNAATAEAPPRAASLAG